jgi:hypothetical protein
MRQSRYTEEQIVGILKESEAGLATAELCRKVRHQREPIWKTIPTGTPAAFAPRGFLWAMI